MSLTTSGYRKVMARKAHKCYWCGEAIEKGETYVTWSCFGDGSASTIKVHHECDRAWQQGMKTDPCYYSEEVYESDHRRGCLCSHHMKECEGCGVTPDPKEPPHES